MREALEVLLDTLRALKRDGVTEVSVEDATLAELRAGIAKMRSRAGADGGNVAPERLQKTAEAREKRAESFPEKPAVPEQAALPAQKNFSAKSASPKFDFSDLDAAQSAARAAGTPPTGTKAERLAALREIVFGDPVCLRNLRAGRKLAFGEGDPDARVFFCGEAPGKEEEIRGRPFVGAAGQLLDKMIAAAGLTRERVYIANIMPWRPETGTLYGDRAPGAEEVAYGTPYLAAQVEVVRPRVIVALGKTALNGLLGFDEARTLGSMRGKRLTFRGVPVVATYHPSYLLRNNSVKAKRAAWEDFLRMMEIAEIPISPRQRNYFLKAAGR